MLKQIFNIKSVIFDMDGVITNTMPDHYQAWKEIFKKEGLRITHHDVYSREGQPGTAFVYEVYEQYKLSITNPKVEAILKAKEVLFKKIVKTRFIQGSRTFLKDLHKSGFKLALVTGTARHELHQILPDSIYNLFDIIVTGNDVKHGKPHPEPYQKALRKLKITAVDAFVIENAPFGIKAAKAAGIKCLALETSLPSKYLQEADGIFKSIKELREKINFKGA
ncbi:hypothetical protein MNBD_UNCLBAC01-1594 [hydrothermal vent metagenome]|uniref:Beta-phosphoglucomutase n=1 Tax=hydrothermal vent metagenome TaxID=652676 RepID=A0A3B1DDZ2_9ZZZZ